MSSIMHPESNFSFKSRARLVCRYFRLINIVHTGKLATPEVNLLLPYYFPKTIASTAVKSACKTKPQIKTKPIMIFSIALSSIFTRPALFCSNCFINQNQCNGMIRLMVVLELNLKLMPFSKIAFFPTGETIYLLFHVNEVIWGLVLVNLAHAVVWLGREPMTGYLIHSDYKKTRGCREACFQ